MPPEGEGGTGSAATGAGAGTGTTDPAGAGTGNDPSKNGGANGQGSKDEPFDAERAKATIEKLRPFEKQSKDQVKKIADLESKLKEFEDAKLSENEKLTKRLAELEAKDAVRDLELQEVRSRSAIEAAAVKAGAVSPGDIYRLVDTAEVEFDDAGNPKNLDKVIDGIRKRLPQMFRSTTGSADGGARGTTANGETDVNAWLRRQAGRST